MGVGGGEAADGKFGVDELRAADGTKGGGGGGEAAGGRLAGMGVGGLEAAGGNIAGMGVGGLGAAGGWLTDLGVEKTGAADGMRGVGGGHSLFWFRFSFGTVSKGFRPRSRERTSLDRH